MDKSTAKPTETKNQQKKVKPTDETKFANVNSRILIHEYTYTHTQAHRHAYTHAPNIHHVHDSANKRSDILRGRPLIANQR